MTSDDVRQMLCELQKYWRLQGVEQNASATTAQIDSLKLHLEPARHPELYAYFESVNGMPPGQTDDALIHFRSISEVLFDLDRLADNIREIEIADYSLKAFVLVLSLDQEGSGGAIDAFDGTNRKRIANTFVDLLREYLRSPQNIANPFN
ncbi:hypothetical protein [Stratiformator vulcanicus]|uniref:hypothetical protein n=1 Tax=Stratiformator vulcanicus TaxID=2527980 RepID=UPI0011A4486A|nr:hypothetical protein [Stratiformator vulcanicus]